MQIAREPVEDRSLSEGRCYTRKKAVTFMATPVLLSEKTYLAAKAAASAAGRTVSDQVEHWVRLGQVYEAAPSYIKPTPPRRKKAQDQASPEKP